MLDDYDVDNFVIGKKDNEHQPFECNLPKLVDYLEKTGKNFSELTEEELSKLK